MHLRMTILTKYFTQYTLYIMLYCSCIVLYMCQYAILKPKIVVTFDMKVTRFVLKGSINGESCITDYELSNHTLCPNFECFDGIYQAVNFIIYIGTMGVWIR